MSSQGVVPRFLSRVHRSRQTPYVAIVFTTIVVMGLITMGTVFGDALSTLASTTVVLLLLVFITVNVSVLVLRRERVDHDHFKAPSEGKSLFEEESRWHHEYILPLLWETFGKPNEWLARSM